MRADTTLGEDATTLYLRWEIVPEMGEMRRLEGLGGPLLLKIPARHYVDLEGTEHERIDLEVPIFPFAGARNFGQAKFRDYESRRAFCEALEGMIVGEVSAFIHDTTPGGVASEGHVFEAAEPSPS